MEKMNKKPPQNNEAEQCLLGCLMLDKNAIIRVSDFVTADDFYKDIHREIYSAMMDIYAKSEPIDIMSVSTRLREKEKLDRIGGADYFTFPIQNVPTPPPPGQLRQNCAGKKSAAGFNPGFRTNRP